MPIWFNHPKNKKKRSIKKFKDFFKRKVIKVTATIEAIEIIKSQRVIIMVQDILIGLLFGVFLYTLLMITWVVGK